MQLLQFPEKHSASMAADLQDSIDWSGTFCLNALPAHPVSNAIKQVILKFPEPLRMCSRDQEGPHQCRGTARMMACLWSLTQMNSCSFR